MPNSKLLAILLLLLVACASSSYYDTYLQSHSGWAPHFPREGADLEETAASLYAPAPPARGIARVNASIRELRLFEFPGSGHAEILAAPILSGAIAPDPDAMHLLIVQSSCTASDADSRHLGDATSWYLFRSDRLEAYDHVRFVGLCRFERTTHPAGQRPAEVDAVLRPSD